jgi:hypothetical protein
LLFYVFISLYTVYPKYFFEKMDEENEESTIEKKLIEENIEEKIIIKEEVKENEYQYSLHPNYFSLMSSNSVNFKLEEKRIPQQIEETNGKYMLGIKREEEELLNSAEFDTSISNNLLLLYMPPQNVKLFYLKLLFTLLVTLDSLFMGYIIIDVFLQGIFFDFLSYTTFIFNFLLNLIILLAVLLEKDRIITIYIGFSTILFLMNVLQITG